MLTLADIGAVSVIQLDRTPGICRARAGSSPVRDTNRKEHHSCGATRTVHRQHDRRIMPQVPGAVLGRAASWSREALKRMTERWTDTGRMLRTADNREACRMSCPGSRERVTRRVTVGKWPTQPCGGVKAAQGTHERERARREQPWPLTNDHAGEKQAGAHGPSSRAARQTRRGAARHPGPHRVTTSWFEWAYVWRGQHSACLRGSIPRASTNHELPTETP